eukprot:998663-Rhodomonas_salina.1
MITVLQLGSSFPSPFPPRSLHSERRRRPELPRRVPSLSPPGQPTYAALPAQAPLCTDCDVLSLPLCALLKGKLLFNSLWKERKKERARDDLERRVWVAVSKEVAEERTAREGERVGLRRGGCPA